MIKYYVLTIHALAVLFERTFQGVVFKQTDGIVFLLQKSIERWRALWYNKDNNRVIF